MNDSKALGVPRTLICPEDKLQIAICKLDLYMALLSPVLTVEKTLLSVSDFILERKKKYGKHFW